MRYQPKLLMLVVILLTATAWRSSPAQDRPVDSTVHFSVTSGRLDLDQHTTRNLAARDTHQVDEAARRYGLSGKGITIGIWDAAGVRTGHVEFRDGRAIQKDAPRRTSSHATHVAGTIGACGETCDDGEPLATGMVPAVTMLTHDWHHDLAELEQAARDQEIVCSNHSYGGNAGWVCARHNYFSGGCDEWHWYGTPWLDEQQAARFGRYDEASRTIDGVAYRQPRLSIFRAAGNGRNAGPAPAQQPVEHRVHPPGWGSRLSKTRREANGVRGGFDTIAGAALGKNVITIGAIDDIVRDPPAPGDVVPTSFSAFGPADDGRVKPDLVANGFLLYSPTDDSDVGYIKKSGTSMATPTATGICALMNELAVDKLGRTLGSDALKATLIHTAMSPYEGPSYQIGWGSLRADRAVRVIADKEGERYRLIRGELTPADREFSFRGHADAHSPVRATLAWIDPPGRALSPSTAIDDNTPALVNDLDLVLIDPKGKPHFPWSIALNRDRPSEPAEAVTSDAPNRVDNVERVDVRRGSEVPGTWTVRVASKDAPVDDRGQPASQSFALVIEGLGFVLSGELSAPVAAPSSDPQEHATEPATAVPRKTMGLLIAVQNYPLELGFNRLNGPINDVRLMHRVLTDGLGVPGEAIRVLIDSGVVRDEVAQALGGVDGPATHCGIAHAFAELKDELEAGDLLYVHFSGHGAHVPDRSGEIEPEDQTWVTWGSRTENAPRDLCPDDQPDLNSYDILDDELNRWLAALDSKGIEVVLVSDSCHSGTVTRNDAAGLRTGPVDTRPHPAADLQYRAAKLDKAVRIGAVEDRDLAREQSFDGKRFGVFTWYWAKALSSATEETIWEDAFKRAAAQVRTQTLDRQRPQITGKRKDTLIHTGKRLPWRHTLPVTEVDGNRVTLDGGLLVGVTEGSIYRHLAGGDPATALRIKIVEARAFTSKASVTSRPDTDDPAEPIELGDLFVEETHVYRSEPIQLWVAGDPVAERLDHQLLDRLRTSLADLEGFELAKLRQDRKLEIYAVRYRRHSDGSYDPDPQGGMLPIPSPDGFGEVWILDESQTLLYEDLRIPGARIADAIGAVRDNLTTFATRSQILALADFPATLTDPVKLRVRVLSPRLGGPPTSEDCDIVRRESEYEERAPWVIYADGAHQHVDADLPEGACMRFEVVNDSTLPVYVYLLNLRPNAELKYIFPYPADPEQYARIDPETSRDYAHPENYAVWFRADDLGTDYLILLVTRSPIDIGLLKLDGYQQRTARGTPRNPLEELLVDALYTRKGIGRTVPEKWSATRIRLDVESWVPDR